MVSKFGELDIIRKCCSVHGPGVLYAVRKSGRNPSAPIWDFGVGRLAVQRQERKKAV